MVELPPLIDDDAELRSNVAASAQFFPAHTVYAPSRWK